MFCRMIGMCRGFSLVELLVVVAVLAVVLGLVFPLFSATLFEMQSRAEVGRLMTAISLARTEAVLRNTTVTLCPTTSPTAAECSGDYSDGWMVFSNVDRDDRLDTGEDDLVRLFHPMPSGFIVTNRAQTRPATDRFTFWPTGSSGRSATLLICSRSALQSQAYGVVINNVGRARKIHASESC